MVTVDEIYVQINTLLGEMARKLGRADFIILTTFASGHPVSYYPFENADEDFMQYVASLVSAIGDGFIAFLKDLGVEVTHDMIFLETADTIILLALMQKGTLAVKVRKPALIGVVRAIVKAYIPKFDELLLKLDEAQAEMLKKELLKGVVPE